MKTLRLGNSIRATARNAKALRWVALAVAVAALTALLVACASAAPSGQQDDDATPTPKPEGIKTPTPTIDPTPTSKPSGDDEEKTTPTPTPTEPLPPTEVPTATPDHQPGPTPTPNPYADIVIDEEFCFKVDLQNPALTRARDGYNAAAYLVNRCADVVGRVIGERCLITSDSVPDEQTQACMKRQAEMIKDYDIRSQVAPDCLGIGLTTDEELLQCIQDEWEEDEQLSTAAIRTGLAIRETIDRDPTVIATEKNAWACLAETGKQDLMADYIDVSRLLFWQNWVDDETYGPIGQLDSLRQEKIQERMRLVDQCALGAGVYQARYDVLMSELRRYFVENPEAVEAWKKFGALEALEEYGAEMLRP